MLRDFITRIIILLVGYAYPAYDCYKSVENKKLEIHQLTYWCKYWILIAILTVFERIGDIIISWLPLYREIKIALLLYLWYPKTKGTSYVYETLLRPFMSRHESDIDRSIAMLKIRGQFVVVNYANVASNGYSVSSHICNNNLQFSRKMADSSQKRDTKVDPYSCFSVRMLHKNINNGRKVQKP